MRSGRSQISLALVFLYLCYGIALAGGVGIAPSEINFEGVLRGGYAETTLTLSNQNNVSTTITIDPKGENKDYLSFSDLGSTEGGSQVPAALGEGGTMMIYKENQSVLGQVTNITIPPQSRSLVKVVASPPLDLALGKYTGVVTFYSHPHLNETLSEQFGTTIAVGFEIPSSIQLTGEQRLEFTVGSIVIKDTEIDNPIELLVSGTNRGNVRATPQIYVKILDRDQTRIIREAGFNGSEYLPTTSGTDRFEISSENMTEGQYWAKVTITLGGKEIKNELLTFDILEVGAMKRSGELVQVFANVWVKQGEIVRVDALFRNIGEISTSAKFKGEALLGGRIMHLLESEEIVVQPGESVNLTSYFTPQETGKYSVKGRVYYSKKLTFPKEAIVNVNPVEGSRWGMLANPTLILILIVITALIILSRKN